MKKASALLVIAVINIVLAMAGLSIWNILIADAAIFSAAILLVTWFGKPQSLIRQASHMNWRAYGIVKDIDGYRDSLLERDGVIARVSFQEKIIYLEIMGIEEGPFNDFLEVERHLIETWQK